MAPIITGRKKVPCRVGSCKTYYVSKEAEEAHCQAVSHSSCQICDIHFADWVSFGEHKVHMGDVEHLCCRFCYKDFRSYEGLAQHMARCHMRKPKFDCSICGFTYNSVKSWVAHVKEGSCRRSCREYLESLRQKKERDLLRREHSNEPRCWSDEEAHPYGPKILFVNEFERIRRRDNEHAARVAAQGIQVGPIIDEEGFPALAPSSSSESGTTTPKGKKTSEKMRTFSKVVQAAYW